MIRLIAIKTKFILLLVGSFLFTLQSYSQPLSGSYSIPGNYSSIQSAVLALNQNGVNGPVIFNIGAGISYSETLSTRIALGSAILNASVSSNNTITFRRAATSLANPQVTAFVGIKTPNSADSIDVIWAISGTDWVTIEGIDLVERSTNTTNVTMMEVGYGLYKASATDGVNNVTIRNCNISLNRDNNFAGFGVRVNVNGSIGIEVMSSIRTSVNTEVTPTSVSGASSFNRFFSNTIQNCNTGIALVGPSVASPYTLADLNNNIGGDSLATGNTIINFGGGTGASYACAAVFISNQYGANVSYNTINNNNGNGVNHANANRGIWLSNSSPGASINVNFNTITITSASNTTSNSYCIDMEMAQSNQSGNTININNNKLINCKSSINTAASLWGIWANSAPSTLNINNNYVYGFTHTGNSSTSVVHIASQIFGVIGTLNINNNTIDSSIINGPSGDFRGVGLYAPCNLVANVNGNTISRINLIANTSGAQSIFPLFTQGVTTVFNAIGNTINSITRNGSLGGTTIGIYSDGQGIQNIRKNTISNFSITGSGANSLMMGIQIFRAVINVDSNLIFNLNVAKVGATSALYGIFNSSTPSSETYSNNQIFNLIHAGTGEVIGIKANHPSVIRMVNKNTIFSLSGSGGNVIGMELNGSLVTINQNKIYSLRNNGTSTGIVHAISILSLDPNGVATISNNLIDSLVAPNYSGLSTAIIGINLNYSFLNTSSKVYYNTIRLAANSSGLNFGTTCILFKGSDLSTVSNFELRNNIIVNNSTPRGTGRTIALANSSNFRTNYSPLSNNNLFYAGIPGPSNLIYAEPGITDQTISAFKARLASFEQASFTENPVFISSVGSSPNFLHLDLTVPTRCESSGSNIPNISGDFDNVIRQGNLGYLGVGKAPDVGADEGDFVPIVADVDSILVEQNSNNVPVSAVNQHIVAIRVHLSNSFGSPTIDSIYLNTLGTTNINDIQNAKIFYTGNAATFNSSKQFGSVVLNPNGNFMISGSQILVSGANYFWVTYDTKSTSTLNNFIDVRVDSLRINGIYRIPLNGNPIGSRRITNALNGTYTVGSGQTYATITAAANDLHSLGVLGPVNFILTDTIYNAAKGEIFPINWRSYSGSSEINTVTVKPASGVATRIVCGTNVPTFELDGIKNLIIDGRPGSTGGFILGSNLIISNATTLAPALRLNNEASNNRIIYTDIRSNNSLAPGTINAGVISFGASSGINGNDNNIIRFSHIHENTGGNPTVGISSIGSGVSESANNDGNIIDSCEIYNFYNATSTTAAIYLGANNSAWQINANKFYQTSILNYTVAAIHRVLWITPNIDNLTSASGFVILNNFVGGNNTSGSGAYRTIGNSGYSINVFDLSVGLGIPTSVQGNTITNFNITSNGGNAVNFLGINMSNGNVNCGNLTGNIIGSRTINGAITFTLTAVSGGTTGIRTNGGTGNTYIIANNVISGFDLIGNASTFAPDFFGISLLNGTNITCTNNLIGDTGLVESIRILSTSATSTVMQRVMGIYINPTSGTANFLVNNNVVCNIRNNYSAPGSQLAFTRGIALTFPTNGNYAITNNRIFSIYSATRVNGSAANSALAGIGVNTTLGSAQVTGNSIYNLKLIGTSTTEAVKAVGIFFSSPVNGNNLVSRNTIHTIGITAQNASAVISGIEIAAGNGNIQNNFIRLGHDSLGTSVSAPCTFRGISKSGGNINLYHNSVYIGGSTSVSTSSNTFAFHRTGIGTDIARNNIFVNSRSRSSGTGKNYAVFLSSNTSLTLNNNIYHGTGAGFIFGTFNGGVSDVLAFQNGWVVSDQASSFANPQFINPSGGMNLGDLHISQTLATPIEGNGFAIATIVDDFDGQTRAALGPVDIGADAGNFISLDQFGPVIGNITLGNTSSTGDRTFVVNITDRTGIPLAGGLAPRVYFKKYAAGNYFSTPAIRTSGTAQNGNYSFTISQSMLSGLSLNDSVYFFVVAQDSAAANFISSAPNGVVALNVNSITTYPTSLFSYRIVPGISGTLNVGSGQTYTSLTNSGGLFEAINNGSITGNINVLITSDLTEDGTHGLNQISETGIGNYTISIKPDSTTERLIAGSFAGGLIRLNGADRVRIDGRFAGSGRYLRFRNRALNGYTFALQNDAVRDTITFCHIESVNNTLGTISFLGTSGTIGNDSNGITHCIISDTLGTFVTSNIPNVGILSQGSIGIGNDFNTIANNEITNFGFNGINLSTTAGDFWNILNNSIYLTIAKANGLTILQIEGGTNHMISGNSIGGSSPNRSGLALTSYNMIGLSVVAVRVSNAITTVQVSNNIFSNISSRNTVNIIEVSAGTVSITGNTFGGGAMPYDTIQNGYDNGIINVSGGLVSIQNNTIGNISYYDGASDRTCGIYVSGGTTTIMGNTIRDIKANSASWGFGRPIAGIQINGGSNHVIEQNQVFNIFNFNTGSQGYVSVGINVPGGNNVSVSRNRIYNIYGLGTGLGVFSNQVVGIYVIGNEGIIVRNNQISIGNNVTGETRVYGILDEDNWYGNEYYNNSIFVNGSTAGGINNSYCFLRTGYGNFKCFNNIFSNKRTTNGTGFNYAFGSNYLVGITPVSNNYNLFLVNDTTRVAEVPLNQGNSISAFNSLYTNAYTYSSNWYALHSEVPTHTLFIDTLVGNLGIVTTHPNSWYVNGKALPLAAVPNDYNNAVRSTTISGGATDIGSIEFTTTTVPPTATPSAAPAPNTTTTYTFANRRLVSLTWANTGTVPSAVNVVYYSGTNAPNLLASKTQYNYYTTITAIGGAGYTYGISLIADSATFGNVAGIHQSRIARSDGANWTLISNLTTSGITGFMQTTSNNLTGFGNFTGTSISNPLPVELSLFNAMAKEGDVVLNWATAKEANNKGFYIERSFDGSNFESLSFVNGRGNSNVPVSYIYTDADAFANTQKEVLYYRLRQIDLDGESSLSEVRTVSQSNSNEVDFIAYPNPFADEVNLSLVSGQIGEYLVEVRDLNGKLVSSASFNKPTGREKVNLSQLPIGIYALNIKADGFLKVFKIVKK